MWKRCSGLFRSGGMVTVMRYKLICVDLDGTLLADDKRIKKQDIEALQKAAAYGIKIALITGRMPAATEFAVRQLGIECIMACNAGTYILEKEQCIYAKYLSPETMREIYESIKPFGTPLWIFRNKQWFVTEKDEFVRNEEKLIQYVPEPVSIDELALKWERERTGPNKVLVGAESGLIQKIYPILKQRRDADSACSSPNYLEIFPKGMNKGNALRIICEKNGFRREEVIAFGDEELDLPMLEAAGTGVAMGNAIEELKRKADFVTKTNNEAGIAYALNKYLNIETGNKII
ncbi:MAG TPA: hypothetical protein DCZ40_00150 [Lachnospiraceae bacterium]|nr:hypothetical protein [Lachnospiraceae bacterium]